MQNVKDFLSSRLKLILAHPIISRALHTFWQAALGVLAAGIFAAHNSNDVKALVIMAVAAGASAVKSYLVAQVNASRG